MVVLNCVSTYQDLSPLHSHQILQKEIGVSCMLCSQVRVSVSTVIANFACLCKYNVYAKVRWLYDDCICTCASLSVFTQDLSVSVYLPVCFV